MNIETEIFEASCLATRIETLAMAAVDNATSSRTNKVEVEGIGIGLAESIEHFARTLGDKLEAIEREIKGMKREVTG